MGSPSNAERSREKERAREWDRERTWDFGRELRSLRDASARSRAEEAQALRRSSEEVERCAIRRQLDESAALQDFLGGLHEDFDSRLERQRAEVTRRIETLDQRIAKLEGEERSGSSLDPSAVQRVLHEAIVRIERSASAAAALSLEGVKSPLIDRGSRMRAARPVAVDEEGEDEFASDEEEAGESEEEAIASWLNGRRCLRTASSSSSTCSGLSKSGVKTTKDAREADADRDSMVRQSGKNVGSKFDKLGLRLVAVAETAARGAAAEVAREAAEGATAKLAELRRQLMNEVEQQRTDAEAAVAAASAEAEAQAEAASMAAAAAKKAASAGSMLLAEFPERLRVELHEEAALAVKAAEAASREPVLALHDVVEKAMCEAGSAKVVAATFSPELAAAEMRLRSELEEERQRADSSIAVVESMAEQALKAQMSWPDMENFSQELSDLRSHLQEELSAQR